MKISVPDFCLVLLIGATGSGKSTFARRHFKPTEILSSDHYRGVVSDDEGNQAATGDAFDVLHYIARKRLAARRLTVIDATNVRPEDRQKLVAIAREHHALAVGFVFNMPRELCEARNRERPDRQFGSHVVRNHVGALRRSLRRLHREGMRYVHRFDSPEQADAVTIERTPLWTDRRDLAGPFDIIGDVHGCCDELESLLGALGYRIAVADGEDGAPRYDVTPPAGRTAVFLGDLVDRGPRIPDTLRLVMDMVAAGRALCVLGNHEAKLLRALRGANVRLTHGLDQSIEQIEAQPEEFRRRTVEFLQGLISHYWLDGGQLTVAHAGLREEMHGRSSGAVRSFALYGETTGETDEFGLPIRYNWAAEHKGRTKVIYGHTPVPEAEWLNGTVCIDTGCVFGGKLTALRYPELELVSVPAARVYCEPVRPLDAPAAGRTGPGDGTARDTLLDVADVLGKRVIATGLHRTVTIQEENAAAALEVMSRFTIDPRWLIYLPPTMSPSETSTEDGLLEHPAEAFTYFKDCGVTRVICQEKHMGSRAVLVVCRDGAAARRRFGVSGDGTTAAGAIFTRTGRAFFDDAATEAAVLGRVRAAMDEAEFWDNHETDWACLDAELMPWSAKAQGLLRHQYAPAGAAARLGLGGAAAALEQAVDRGVPADDLLARFAARRDMGAAFADAYRRYCWPVGSVDDLKLAPFHLLATEGAVHADKDHAWHMESLAKIRRSGDGLLAATEYRTVDLADIKSVDEAIAWWTGLTERGGEGMVVKPETFIARSPQGLVQPALKCRGREYLRIIYGPEYTVPEHLARLRRRGLGLKRSLALREFSLGVTALTRFVDHEPLTRVHECVFGVLALETQPVDPRL